MEAISAFSDLNYVWMNAFADDRLFLTYVGKI
jgi:hypothetical protein